MGVAVDNLQVLEFPNGILSFEECRDYFAKIQVDLDSTKQLCTKHPEKGSVNTVTLIFHPNANIICGSRHTWLPGRFWGTPVYESHWRGNSMVSSWYRQLWGKGMCEIRQSPSLHQGVRVRRLDI